MKKRIKMKQLRKAKMQAEQARSKELSLQEAWDALVLAMSKDSKWAEASTCLFVSRVFGSGGSAVLHNASEDLKIISTSKISIR